MKITATNLNNIQDLIDWCIKYETKVGIAIRDSQTVHIGYIQYFAWGLIRLKYACIYDYDSDDITIKPDLIKWIKIYNE